MRKIPHEQLQQTIAFRNTWIRLFTTKRTSFINFFTRGLMIRAVKLSLDWIHGKLGEIYFMMKNIFHLTGQRTAFVRSAVWVWVRELLYLAFVKSWQLDFSIIKRFKTYLRPVWNFLFVWQQVLVHKKDENILTKHQNHITHKILLEDCCQIIKNKYF